LIRSDDFTSTMPRQMMIYRDDWDLLVDAALIHGRH
jgi:hypothetical protein